MTKEEFKDKFPRMAVARKVRQLLDARHNTLMQTLRVEMDDVKGVQASIREIEVVLDILYLNDVKPETSQ